MKSFRVYRVFALGPGVSEAGRRNYRFSIIVSDESADYVVHPAISPEKTLKFLRERLVRIVKIFKSADNAPNDIVSWARAAAYNLGIYNKFSLVLAVDDEAEPLTNFEEIRAREEGQIERWMKYDVMPIDSAAEETNE